MKQFILSLIALSFSVTVWAEHKPNTILVRFNTSISVPAYGNGSYEVTGADGAKCWFYGYSSLSSTIPLGQSIEMKALYWDGEASWGNSQFWMNCDGGGIGNESNDRPMPKGTMSAMKSKMTRIFSLKIIDN